jgi:hypothetical protein
MVRSHLKKRILVQDRDGSELKTGGPPEADRRVFDEAPTRRFIRLWRIGPKDFFEIASRVTGALEDDNFGINGD